MFRFKGPGQTFLFKQDSVPDPEQIARAFAEWNPDEINITENRVIWECKHSLAGMSFKMETNINKPYVDLRFFPVFQTQTALLTACTLVISMGFTKVALGMAILFPGAFLLGEIFYISLSIHRHMQKSFSNTLVLESEENKTLFGPGQCPACGYDVSDYHERCPDCGLVFGKGKKIKSKTDSTGTENFTYVFKGKE